MTEAWIWVHFKDPVFLVVLVESWSPTQEVEGSSPFNDKYFCRWLDWKHLAKRKHSSRSVRTVRCSSRLGCVCFRRGCVLPEGGVPVRGVPAGGCTFPSACWDTHTLSPSVDRILDTRFWKHYLSTTSFADGKNYTDVQDFLGLNVFAFICCCGRDEFCTEQQSVKSSVIGGIV